MSVIPDKDCSKKFPYRSSVVINKKLYDDFCFNDKECSKYKDTNLDSEGNPIPWPSKCSPNTFKKLPKSTVNCNSIGKSVEEYEEELKNAEQLYASIRHQYKDNYPWSLVFGRQSDYHKKAMQARDSDYPELLKTLNEILADAQSTAEKKDKNVQKLSEYLDNDVARFKQKQDKLLTAKNNLLAMGGEEMKDAMYDSTSGHIIQTIYYGTAIFVMGVFLYKINKN
tara:strand:- start:283 stop:957 length:675 start_codon:yes stop_codon:yes gene_type:complete